MVIREDETTMDKQYKIVYKTGNVQTVKGRLTPFTDTAPPSTLSNVSEATTWVNVNTVQSVTLLTDAKTVNVLADGVLYATFKEEE